MWESWPRSFCLVFERALIVAIERFGGGSFQGSAAAGRTNPLFRLT
jgi:hypothetical protein